MLASFMPALYLRAHVVVSPLRPTAPKEEDEHALLAPNDFDRDLEAGRALHVLRAHDTREHALAEICVDVVAAVVEKLAQDNLVVALVVIVVVREARLAVERAVDDLCAGARSAFEARRWA